VDPDFCDLVEDSGLGMDESTRQELLKETVLLEEKRRYCRTGLGLQLCKSMIKKNGGNSGLRANWERDKMIVSLPKPQKMDNVNVLI
jgi:light-regulated signal transduction histidine kinase (bacteriophytochrome)